MTNYVAKVINSFTEDIHGLASTPAGENLFQEQESEEGVVLDKTLAQCIHGTKAQLLFLTMRCGKDIQTAMAFSTTQVKEPDEDHWMKLQWVLKYLHCTVYMSWTLDVSDMKLVR